MTVLVVPWRLHDFKTWFKCNKSSNDSGPATQRSLNKKLIEIEDTIKIKKIWNHQEARKITQISQKYLKI